MKEYIKPEIVEISFASEVIADVTGDQGNADWSGENEVP